MKNLENFYYTQHSLQAFDSCPLKFKKRYIENIRWGELPDEDVRKQVQAGRDFHLLAYRYFMGIDIGDMYFSTEKLNIWFNNLKKKFPLDNNNLYLPEHKLRMNMGNVKLEANFDLILIKDNQVIIWDWKTGNVLNSINGSSKSKRLKSSLQTIVYMYVLKELGCLVKNDGIKCENLKMCYWHPQNTDILAEIVYSDQLHEMFFRSIEERIETIRKYDYSTFDKTMYAKHCRFCEFNCLCNKEKIDYEAVHMENYT